MVTTLLLMRAWLTLRNIYNFLSGRNQQKDKK